MPIWWCSQNELALIAFEWKGSLPFEEPEGAICSEMQIVV